MTMKDLHDRQQKRPELFAVLPAPDGLCRAQIVEDRLTFVPVEYVGLENSWVPRLSERDQYPLTSCWYSLDGFPYVHWEKDKHRNKTNGSCECGSASCRWLAILDTNNPHAVARAEEDAAQRQAWLTKVAGRKEKSREYARKRKEKVMS